jgi:hypothetical protein
MSNVARFHGTGRQANGRAIRTALAGAGITEATFVRIKMASSPTTISH